MSISIFSCLALNRMSKGSFKYSVALIFYIFSQVHLLDVKF